jgi:hypothetical protein
MTDAISLKPDLGRYGLWTSGKVTPELAVEIQKLGYSTLWLGGSPATQLKFVEPVLKAVYVLLTLPTFFAMLRCKDRQSTSIPRLQRRNAVLMDNVDYP